MQAFGLDIRYGKGVAARVMLNGIVVGEKAPGDLVAQSLALQHDVVPGANRIEIVIAGAGVSPYASPRAVDADPGDFFVEAALELDSIKELADRYEITTTEIEHREWRPGGPVTLPHRIAIPFTAPLAVSRPAWLDAQAVEPEAVRAEVAALLGALRDRLAVGDYPGYQRLMRIRNADMARAYPTSGSTEQRAATDSAMLAEALGPEPELAPIDPASLRLTAEADGRLLRVERTGGHGALLALGPSRQPVELAVGLARLGGKLVAVR